MTNINSFLRQNAPLLTVKDLAQELGIEEYSVRQKCSELGIAPIKKGEQTKKYILAQYKFKTPAQIAKILDLSEAKVRTIYKELNLPFSGRATKQQIDDREISLTNKNEKEQTSVREILGNFKVDHSIHYYPLKGFNDF